MGELRQRGNVWWIRYYRDGRRFEESSGSTTKKAATTLLQLREGDGAKGIPVTPQIGRLRFEAAVADVVNDYRTNGKRSLGHVERRIRKHLTPFFGGRRMTAISTPDIRAYIAQRQASVTCDDGTDTPGASNAEINRELAIVKRAFRLALQAGTLLAIPHVPMLREGNVRSGFFERDAFDTVRAALPGPLRAVVTFAYLTGWRVPSEVLTLQWRQVDRDTGIVRLEPGTTKNAEGRVFPYGDRLPELRDVMQTQWAITKRIEQARTIVCPWVFHRNGRPIRDFRGAWEKATEQAGCPGRIPHDFRRTAVRNLVRAGVPEKTAMQLTGHKTRHVFDRYDIVDEADLSAGVERLALMGTKKGQSERSGTVQKLYRRAK